MLDKLERAGAKLHIGGANWNEADAQAQQLLSREPDALYVPPFDHPLIWQGHSTIVDELSSQLPKQSRPSRIVLSVGGGGLLRGVQLGLERAAALDATWADVKITAVETEVIDPAEGMTIAISLLMPVRCLGRCQLRCSEGCGSSRVAGEDRHDRIHSR
jgi:L-serine/L-threonine ammonia-lyase